MFDGFEFKLVRYMKIEVHCLSLPRDFPQLFEGQLHKISDPLNLQIHYSD